MRQTGESESETMKDTLVTLIGGGGFVGRYVAQALLTAGARVRVAGRDPRQAWFLKPLGGLGQTQFVAADVRKADTIVRAVEGADAVVNLAGAISGDLDALHVEGARNVARASAAAGIAALVHVSALGADADAEAQFARTKGEGEAAVRAAFARATIVRPSLVFGREDRFTNRFAEVAAKMPVVPIVRAATRMQPVFAGDVAAAIVKALGDAGQFGGKTFELGGPDVLTVSRMWRWIAEQIGREPGFVELPDAIGSIVASAGFLPCAPVTRTEWQMLQRDCTVAANTESFAALGLEPTPLAAIAPHWLVRFRRNGRFAEIDRAA